MKTPRLPSLWLLALLFLASCEVAPGPAPTARSARQSGDAAMAAEPEARPGLGTRWGETRQSRVEATSFRRATPSRPLASATIHYNDAAGIAAMVQAAPRRVRPELAGRTDELVSVEIRDESGRVLPGLPVGDRWFVVGEQGRRYSILVRNRTHTRLEVLLSVDGLDVLDGRTASFAKRGYLVAANETLRVEGFRKSWDAVAAFRFSSVSESYANRKHGNARNVGVLGVAIFHEQGTDPFNWDEAERRLRAEAFPGHRFGSPPEPMPIRPPARKP